MSCFAHTSLSAIKPNCSLVGWLGYTINPTNQRWAIRSMSDDWSASSIEWGLCERLVAPCLATDSSWLLCPISSRPSDRAFAAKTKQGQEHCSLQLRAVFVFPFFNRIKHLPEQAASFTNSARSQPPATSGAMCWSVCECKLQAAIATSVSDTVCLYHSGGWRRLSDTAHQLM